MNSFLKWKQFAVYVLAKGSKICFLNRVNKVVWVQTISGEKTIERERETRRAYLIPVCFVDADYFVTVKQDLS